MPKEIIKNLQVRLIAYSLDSMLRAISHTRGNICEMKVNAQLI